MNRSLQRRRAKDAVSFEVLDHKICHILRRNADDMLENLFAFCNYKVRNMSIHMTQFKNFSHARLENELRRMTGLQELLQQRNRINAIDFLGRYYRLMADNRFIKSGQYLQQSALACASVIQDIYEMTLESMGISVNTAPLLTLMSPTHMSSTNTKRRKSPIKKNSRSNLVPKKRPPTAPSAILASDSVSQIDFTNATRHHAYLTMPMQPLKQQSQHKPSQTQKLILPFQAPQVTPQLASDPQPIISPHLQSQQPAKLSSMF